METKVKKHRFNAVDAVIIIAVAALIGAAILLFTSGRVVTAVQTVSLEYVIEIKDVREEFKDNFKVGDMLVDSVAKYHLGEVVSYTSRNATYTGTDLEGGSLTVSDYPGRINVELTVVSEATVGADGRYILDGGFDMSVGTGIYLRLPDYAGRGYCTQIRETEAK